jgi:hypothetical protein
MSNKFSHFSKILPILFPFFQKAWRTPNVVYDILKINYMKLKTNLQFYSSSTNVIILHNKIGSVSDVPPSSSLNPKRVQLC